MYPVEIRDIPEMRLHGIPHRGPYHEIGPAFQRLGSELAKAGLIETATHWTGVYHEDADNTAPENLRSHACCVLPEGTIPPDGMEPVTFPATRAAVLTFKGDYQGLAAAWKWFSETWLPGSGEHASGQVCAEIYRSMAPAVPIEEQLTELITPID